MVKVQGFETGVKFLLVGVLSFGGRKDGGRGKNKVLEAVVKEIVDLVNRYEQKLKHFAYELRYVSCLICVFWCSGILPPPAFVKANCNVSFNVKSGDASVDAIIHDDEGCLIEGNAKKFKVTSTSFVEAFVVLLKTFTSISVGFQKVIVESDNACLIYRLNVKSPSI
ncbi:hypothetical protein V6N13_001322 [Hibiscus sabdariffa]|uniref:RNase H type-1 domain-containing protein n=1 Tax=Hibiscus sabdariffa TaxID=183260 RepID=A0ABR2G8I8_9ROSI